MTVSSELRVQWHPEEAGDPRPFAALVAAATSYRSERTTSRANAAQ